MAGAIHIRITLCLLLITSGFYTRACAEISFRNVAHPQPDTTIDQTAMGRNASYRQEKAKTYLQIGQQEVEESNFAEALRYFFSAMYELEILGDSARIFETKIRIGAIFHQNQLFHKALEYYSASERMAMRSGTISRYPDLIEKMGGVFFGLKDYPNALEYFSRSADIYSDVQADSSYIRLLFRKVQCHNALMQYDQSLEYNFVILAHYQKTGNVGFEIIGLNNIGFTYKNLGNFQEALNYFSRAASKEVETFGNPGPVTLVNQAIVYQNMNDNAMAIRKLNEASRLVDNLNDERLEPEYNHLAALVYFNLKDYHNALQYNRKSISLGEKTRNAIILEDAYLLSFRIYEMIYNYEESMASYKKHLVLKDSLERQQLVSQRELSATAFRVEEINRETESLWASEELSYLELQRLKLDSANRRQELEILYKTDSIQRITIQNQRLENQRAQQALLLKEEQVYAARKAKESDSLRQIGKIQVLEIETQRLVQKEQMAQIGILDKENKISELELRKVRTRIKWLVVFGVLALIILFTVVQGLRYAKKTNKILLKQKNEIVRQKNEIEYERNRSDKLLLNILPVETAEELKEKGSATPRHYDMVSVLFTDFKGFTNIAEKLTPEELIAELNNCFLEFDKIIDNHNLEKIKTIGDAYMCAGGIPVANATNPHDTVQAGLEIKAYMEGLKAEREAQGLQFWELRIGIHTGPVIAGVVGKNKFAYDIWGDAVNTASRMESSGVPGKVNISGNTFALVKDKYNCSYRGKINAKNKGEIDMYIVDGIL